jgi:O-methyltransferase involved in polyketide biosynthesis
MVPAEASQFMEDLFVERFRALAPELCASCPDRASVLAASMQASAGPPLILARSRYAEDVLAKVAKQGVRQYVIIGAGLDSFALRRPDSLGHLQTFEVDSPARRVALLEAAPGGHDSIVEGVANPSYPCPPSTFRAASDRR